MTILEKPIPIIDKLCEQPPENCEPSPPDCKPCPPPDPACEPEKPDNCEREKVDWKDKGDSYGREEKGDQYAKNGDDCTPGKEPVCKPQCEEEEPCKQVCEEDNECDVTAALACLPTCEVVNCVVDSCDPCDTNGDWCPTPDTFDLAA